MPGDRTVGKGGPARPEDHPQRVEHLVDQKGGREKQSSPTFDLQ